MDKSEPSLVPEWLRTSGSGTGSGGASHHFASSQSDGPLLALPKRTKSSKSIGNSDGLNSFIERNSSSNGGRTLSSNGSAKHEKNLYSRSYSNFTRGQRDRERDRLTVDNHWDADYSDPVKSLMTGRIEKDVLRRSQSMVSRKQNDILQRRAYTDLSRSGQINPPNGNGLLSVGGMEKVAFERDFPSLVSEERPITPDIGRVPSPGVTRSMQGLSIGNSALIGGEGWTSALAEVPVGVGGNTTASTVYQPAVVSSAPASSSATTGLNMAETLLQAPSRSHSAQQPSVQNQKREELAVLQSMKLIPMPSMPKNMALNPSDKLKPKTTPRSVDPVAVLKNGHQLPSLQLGTQLVRGANVKIDGPKKSHTGKLLVLKPARENGVSLALKDTSSPAGSVTSKVVNGQGAGTSTCTPVASKNPVNPRHSISTKISAFAPSPGSMVDKKPSLAQAQSRSDFFNLVRKKSMSNTSTHVESSDVSSVGEKSDEHDNGASTPESPAKNDDEVKCNGEACAVSQRLDDTSNNDFSDSATIFPDEEEAAFLRSLGWEENAGDDEGLTEEEINAFYQEYIKLRPASKLCRGLQLKMAQAEPPTACTGGPSSEFNASDSLA